MKPLLKTIRPSHALETMFQSVREFLPEQDALYADPFCGIAEVPFELELKNCILSDNNPHYINLYRHVQNGTFLKGRDRLSIETGTKRSKWADNRVRFNKLLAKGEIDTAEAAQLTFYLSHISTSFRFGDVDNRNPRSKIVFTGEHDPVAELPEVDWQGAQALMADWKLLNLADYTHFFQQGDIKETTPLVVSAPIFRRLQWDGTEWTDTEHRALFERLNRHSGDVLVFHPKRSTIQRIYSPWFNGNPVLPTQQRVFKVLPR